jgi:hypothetical protein
MISSVYPKGTLGTYLTRIHELCYLRSRQIGRKALETGHEICVGWPVVRQMSKLHCVSLRHRILDLDDVLVIAAVWHIVSRALEARASEN